jgi:hypothetical protein
MFGSARLLPYVSILQIQSQLEPFHLLQISAQYT